MARERAERRLAAILAADVAGYSRLMGADEEDTLARLKAHRRELIDPKIGEPRGCIVRGKVDAEFDDIGEQRLKNITRPLRVYRVKPAFAADRPAPAYRSRTSRRWPYCRFRT